MKCMLNMDISCFENSLDQDQLASEMQGDHNPHFPFCLYARYGKF